MRRAPASEDLKARTPSYPVLADTVAILFIFDIDELLVNSTLGKKLFEWAQAPPRLALYQ
jgi:hypothetical protein